MKNISHASVDLASCLPLVVLRKYYVLVAQWMIEKKINSFFPWNLPT